MLLTRTVLSFIFLSLSLQVIRFLKPTSLAKNGAVSLSVGIFNCRALRFFNRILKEISRAVCPGHAFLTHTTRNDARFFLSMNS